MRSLIWAIPLFPLAGFLINGLIYLLTHRTKGVAHGHEDAADGHGEAHAVPATAGSHDTVHGHAAHVEIPFKPLHTVVGVGSVAIACLLAFGAIFDIGLSAFAHGASHSVNLYTWIPMGLNQSVSQVPGAAHEWVVNVAFRLDSLSALMLIFVTFVGTLIHVYSVGYMGHEEGYGRFFAYLNQIGRASCRERV